MGRGMADPGGLGEIGKLAGAAAGGGGLMLLVTRVLGGLLQGWISGAGPQEKELRSDMAAELKRLREAQTAMQNDLDELRTEVRHLTIVNLHLLTSRAEARALCNALERQHGVPVTGWPDDPKETP